MGMISARGGTPAECAGHSVCRRMIHETVRLSKLVIAGTAIAIEGLPDNDACVRR